MPGLTISTSSSRPSTNIPPPRVPGTTGPGRPRSGSTSPTRPPVSPITPVLAPAQPPFAQAAASSSQPGVANSNNFAQGRPAFTHSQPDQVGMPPPLPAPEPIHFDENADVLALRSAVSILQLQRQRALADMQRLARAKDDALARPAQFVDALAAGQVGHDGDPLFPSAGGRGARAGHDDDDEDEDDEDDQGQPSSRSGAPAWATLPKAQNVVRCPPVNWAQYAVVGESLDKIHAEQLARPSQGVPAVIGPGGAIDFKTDSREGEQRRLVGVAAPYAPGRDKLEKKPKGPKR